MAIYCYRFGVKPQMPDTDESRPASTTIARLPDETLLIIFSKLAYYEILRHVRPVCRHWHAVSYDKTLVLRDLKFGTGFGGLSSFNTNLVTELVGQAPHLRSFEYFSEVHRIEPILQELAENCPRLEVLELGCQPLSTRSISTLAIRCPLITCLSLCDIKGGFGDEYVPFAKLKHLKVLQIERCSWVNLTFMSALVNSRPNLETLHLFHLPYIHESSLAQLLRSVRPTLRNLSLGYLPGNHGLGYLPETLFSEIFECRLLENCFLARSNWRLHTTLNMLDTMPNLKSLRFQEFPYLVNGFMRKVWPSMRFNHLTEVTFIACKYLFDEMISRLAVAAPRLSILHIENCQYITEKGLLPITTWCLNLKQLSLVKMNLGRLCFLTNIQSSLQSLKVLIYNCQFSSGALSGFMIRLHKNLFVVTEKNKRLDLVSSLLANYPSLHRQRIVIDVDVLDENKYPVCPKLSSFMVRRSL